MRRLKIAGMLAALLALAAAPSGAARDRSMAAVRASFPHNSSRILDQPDRFTLYALNPGNPDPEEKSTGRTFYGYRVVGEKEITDPKLRAELVQALYQGMAEQKVGARCFIPHHAIRATRDGKTVDLVLCFTCQWVIIHSGGSSKKALLSARSIGLYDRALK